MTEKEAIEMLKAVKGYVKYGGVDESTNMAIAALEKQIPKKPTRNGGLEEDIKIGNAIFKKGTSVLSKCPNCGGWLRPMQKYCSDCGKSIDWSNEE